MWAYVVRRLVTRRLHDLGLVEHRWQEEELHTVEWGEVDFVWCDGCGSFFIEEHTRDHEVE